MSIVANSAARIRNVKMTSEPSHQENSLSPLVPPFNSLKMVKERSDKKIAEGTS